jgi:predicted dehydrogenase
MNRRHFLQVAALAGLGSMARAEDNSPPRGVLIGATGRGDYGHSDELALPDAGIQLVAIADADPAGLAKMADRLLIGSRYTDYREMLAKEQPQYAVVATRQADQHRDMMLAALRAGAHVYSEKPFTTCPAESDEVLAEAEKRGLRIAVAHQMRLHPGVLWVKRAIEEKQFGELLEIHAMGKQDTGAGGEDMMVLGTHLFDVMRLFAGDVQWCTARVRWQGRDITRADARVPKDNVGAVAGDDVHAQFALASGTFGTFTSQLGRQPQSPPYGLELIFAKGAVRVVAGIDLNVFVSEGPAAWKAGAESRAWKIPAESVAPAMPAGTTSARVANARVVQDWLAAVREKREPVCSGRHAAMAVEMVAGVYRAALEQKRVGFPLTERGHPLLG